MAPSKSEGVFCADEMPKGVFEMLGMNFVILWVATLAVSEVATTVAQPVDPRRFGYEGLLMSDRANGQYCASVFAPRNIRVAWQSGFDENPDLGAQALDAFGRKAAGSSGWVIPKNGIQTQPNLLSRGVVFSESSDGHNWRVLYAAERVPQNNCTVLSDESGSLTELSATETNGGQPLACWIRTTDTERRLELCIFDRDSVHTITICEGAHAFQDVHMVVSGSLATIAWSDFRDPMHPSVYGQMVDLPTRQLLWPTNGLNLAPGSSWAWNPELADASDAGYVALAYNEWDGVQFTTLRYQVADYQMNFRHWPALTLAGPSSGIGEHAVARLGEESVVAWDEDTSLRTAFVAFGGDVEIVTHDVGARIDDLCVGASDRYAWVVWNDDRRGRNEECVMAQKYDASHTPHWPESGLRVCEHDGAQRAPVPALVVDDPSALVVAWEDYRDHPMIPRIALQLLK